MKGGLGGCKSLGTGVTPVIWDVPGEGSGTEGCGRVPGAREEPTLTAIWGVTWGVGVPVPTPWDTVGAGHLLSPYYLPLWVRVTLSVVGPLHPRQVELPRDKTVLGLLDPVQGRRLFTFSPEGLADLGLPNSRGPGTSEQEGKDSMTLESLRAWRSRDPGDIDFVCRLCARKQRGLSEAKATLSPLLGQGLRGRRRRTGHPRPVWAPSLATQDAHQETPTSEISDKLKN